MLWLPCMAALEALHGATHQPPPPVFGHALSDFEVAWGWFLEGRAGEAVPWLAGWLAGPGWIPQHSVAQNHVIQPVGEFGQVGTFVLLPEPYNPGQSAPWGATNPAPQAGGSLGVAPGLPQAGSSQGGGQITSPMTHASPHPCRARKNTQVCPLDHPKQRPGGGAMGQPAGGAAAAVSQLLLLASCSCFPAAAAASSQLLIPLIIYMVPCL